MGFTGIQIGEVNLHKGIQEKWLGGARVKHGIAN